MRESVRDWIRPLFIISFVSLKEFSGLSYSSGVVFFSPGVFPRTLGQVISWQSRNWLMVEVQNKVRTYYRSSHKLTTTRNLLGEATQYSHPGILHYNQHNLAMAGLVNLFVWQ